MVVSPILADTYLDSAAPTASCGDADALHVTDTNPGLFKFDLSPIEPGERIAEARLTLHIDNNVPALTCSTDQTCKTCVSSVENWKLYWLTSDWSQLNATHNDADVGRAWNGPGASRTERSELVASGPPTVSSTNLEMVVGPANLMMVKPERYASEQRQLSVLILIQGSAWFESSANQPCTSLDRPPVLELVLCR